MGRGEGKRKKTNQDQVWEETGEKSRGPGEWIEICSRPTFPTWDPSHVQTPNPDTIADAKMCLQTGVWHGCHLTKTDTDTPNQALD